MRGGATPTLPSGDPFLIPPGVIHAARNIGNVTAREAFHQRGRRGATPRGQLRLKAKFRGSGWDRAIPLVSGRKIYNALWERSGMFEGLERLRVEKEGASINAVHRGNGLPVLLLLRGSVQTLAMWHLVAPRLVKVVRCLSEVEGGSSLLSFWYQGKGGE